MAKIFLVLSIILIGTVGFIAYKGGLKYKNLPQGSNDVSIYTSSGTPFPLISSRPKSPITLKGTIVCLPAKNTKGPQPLVCALGLKKDNGDYYGLSFINQQDLISDKTAGGNVVQLSGTLIPLLQEDKYVSKGTIDVTSITVLEKSKLPELE